MFCYNITSVGAIHTQIEYSTIINNHKGQMISDKPFLLNKRELKAPPPLQYICQ